MTHRADECEHTHWDCACGFDNCHVEDGDTCHQCSVPRPGSDAEYYSRRGDFQRGGGPVPHTLPRRDWDERDREII